ncbi:hypothetical protein SCOCK_200086 [Actinacidiphila cocklensis]|uniref:Uncharacterized protein n=1 Tax=Actinacidiphila cocklensis TaxID=887465 RepID=A0A9W4E555_9ACTN|nr:hypothetical protein SCOCK_200086 [Actinacidiphila cocklensis]
MLTGRARPGRTLRLTAVGTFAPGLTAADVWHASGPAFQPRHPPGGQAHRPCAGLRR